MTNIRIVQVDAFAEKRFTGNPAAVCFLDETADAQWMQHVAGEMNLSETAFVRPIDGGFELRWFTPAIEVDLCGHATLAAAHALWTERLADSAQPIQIHTRSGVLTCNSSGVDGGGERLIELDFPATPAAVIQPPTGLFTALGAPSGANVKPVFIGQTKFDKLLVVDSEAMVRAMTPNFNLLRAIPTRGVIVTSTTDDPRFDFISRFFAPAAGINEDPVTGSAHCCLGPYWAGRLQKTQLTGYQASERGGVVRIRIKGDRVILGGHAVTVLRGELV